MAALTSLLAGCGGDDVPRPSRGVAVDIAFAAPAQDELRDVDAAAELGAEAVRVAIQWSNMEPLTPGTYADYYLDRLDALVARARDRGVGVLLTPVFTPCWAASGKPSCSNAAELPAIARRPPADPRTFARFAAFLAERYGDALAGVEVWNEPNLEGFWDTDAPARDYAALLEATYPEVKRVAPDLPVVAGAVAGADAGFLAQLYDAGISGSYDVLSLHVYNDGRPPQAEIDPSAAAATLLQGMRNVALTLKGRRERRPVWITELGWNTSTQRGQPFLDGVSAQQQADYLRQAVEMLQDPELGIDVASALFVYQLRDAGADPANPLHRYGLLEADRSPKPAFPAVRDAFAEPFGR